jgi:hypothetical protein
MEYIVLNLLCDLRAGHGKNLEHVHLEKGGAWGFIVNERMAR